MTLEAKLKNSLVNHRQVYAALTQLSEPDLVRLLQTVKALRQEFQPIRSIKGEPVEAVSATQNLLKLWNAELERILGVKQAKDSYDRLHNWENEGGSGGHVSK